MTTSDKLAAAVSHVLDSVNRLAACPVCRGPNCKPACSVHKLRKALFDFNVANPTIARTNDDSSRV